MTLHSFIRVNSPRAAVAAGAAERAVPRRLPNEFYPTPPEAVRALLSVETFEGSIWEPACGEGAIANVLTDAGHKVVSTDLVKYGFGIAGVDFLKELRPRAKHIVTIPPYGSGLADAFIEKSLAFMTETGGTVAMLLNMSSLAHRRRTAWWKQKPPARLYAIDDIVCWPSHTTDPHPTTSPSTATSGRFGHQTTAGLPASGGCRARISAPAGHDPLTPTQGDKSWEWTFLEKMQKPMPVCTFGATSGAGMPSRSWSANLRRASRVTAGAGTATTATA